MECVFFQLYLKFVINDTDEIRSTMMRIAVFLFVFGSFHLSAQTAFFKMFSNNGYDYGHSVFQCSDSGYVVAGTSSSFSSSSDAFLLRLDKYGNFRWSKNFGGSESDLCRRTLNLNDSIYYLIGESSSETVNGFNLYCVKTDSAGNLLQEKRFDEAGWQRPLDAVIGSDQFIYLVGETTNTPNQASNFFIAKLNTDLDTIWTKNFGTDGDDRLYSLKQANDTTFIAVGETYVADSSNLKAAIINFSNDGEIRWNKHFGNNGEESLRDVYFVGTRVYGVGTAKLPAYTDQDEFLFSIDVDGGNEVESSFHSDGDVTYDQACQYGSNSRIYIVSHFQNQYSAGGTIDAGVTRFTDNLSWDQAFVNVGFAGVEYIDQIRPTMDGGAVAVGYSEDSNNGGSALFVLKIGVNDSFPTVSNLSPESLLKLNEMLKSQARIFPNPASESFTIENPEATTVEVLDSKGLQLYKSPFSSTQQIAVSNWSPGMYLVRLTDEAGNVSSSKIIVE